LLESSLARINWIRAVDKICVEQLFSCKKCRAIACRAIAIRAVHPHSLFSGEEECLQRPNSSDLVYDVRDVIKTSPTNGTFDRCLKTVKLSNDKICRYFEIIQNRGEVVFVPSGWHHQVENCENTISINHNWFNGANVTSFIWKNLESAFRLVEVLKNILTKAIFFPPKNS
jgi:hypothetical protein